MLFYSQGPGGTLEDASEHGGCPVLRGEKWAANMWVWNGPRYQTSRAPPGRAAGSAGGVNGTGGSRGAQKALIAPLA